MYIDIQNCKKDHLSLLRTCPSRSRRRNISIRLDYSEILPTFEDKDKEMVQLLVDNCERWYSLQISDYHLEIHNVLRKAYGRIPNLTNLVLSRREPAGVTPIRVFEIAPKLRTVEIHGGFGLVLGFGNPSLISYKDYRRSGQRVNLDEHFTILQSCRNLQTFTKLSACRDCGSEVQNPPIFLPQLRHFHGSHKDLIKCMMTPNLESFHLDIFYPRDFADLNAPLNVRDFFIRTGYRGLSKLTLSNTVTSHILDIHPLVLALAVLQFRFAVWPEGYRDVEEDVFRSLFQKMTDVDEVGMSRVVANLREFSFMVHVHLDCRILCINEIFLEMVASRAKTLEKVEVVGSVPSGIWSAKRVSVLESLLKDGMDISLNGVRPWDFSGALNDSMIIDQRVIETCR
ncbi:hypothetical protein EDD18DRAFT_1413842 [Armillaria luteobubalina]|uniref:Uncharacterized protein n=1 Tax=Armillaria luteobubalina TaxID=153913 RepID=A0AA39PXJ7_9AGAR|nr:hypothetical protein EDD18DRAFT_1413842 [Armillaria luteobubalina]